jgi:hypothetical protein
MKVSFEEPRKCSCGKAGEIYLVFHKVVYDTVEEWEYERSSVHAFSPEEAVQQIIDDYRKDPDDINEIIIQSVWKSAMPNFDLIQVMK